MVSSDSTTKKSLDDILEKFEKEKTESRGGGLDRILSDVKTSDVKTKGTQSQY